MGDPMLDQLVVFGIVGGGPQITRCERLAGGGDGKDFGLLPVELWTGREGELHTGELVGGGGVWRGEG